MKVAIVIHSLTGNTLSVGNGIKQKLDENGLETELIKIEPIGGENKNEADYTKIRFQDHLNVEEYDFVIIGSPVRGFSMSPVLKAYLNKAGDLHEKKFYIYVTHFFPFAFMGGKNAVKQVKNQIEDNGGIVIDTAIIDWKNPSREKQIDNLIENWSHIIQ